MSEAEALADIQKDAMLDQFCAVTGASTAIARSTLEACAWNLELAINMQIDFVPEASEAPIAVDAYPSVDQAATSNVPSSSSRAPNGTDDEVRPPIPPRRQVLVEDGFSFMHMPTRPRRPGGLFDGFRDFQAEARWQEDEMSRNEVYDNSDRTSEKRRTLEELFRPPLDLMFRGSMDGAKEEGCQKNKWLMVNIQDGKEFACQILNRDVWSSPEVKQIVSENFIFWQVYKDSSEGARFMQFYPFENFPYIAILDPRTGENLRSWSTITDTVSFCDLVPEFLSDHPTPNGTTGTAPVVFIPSLPSGSNNNIASSSTNHVSDFTEAKQRTIYDDSEDAQLRAAIAASLRETKPRSGNVPNEDDSDLETFPDSDEDSFTSAQTSAEAKPSVSEPIIEKADIEDRDWKKYLGTGDKFELMLRLPEGQKELMSFTADSKLKALFLYLSSKGYSMKEYDLVRNIPRMNVHEVSEDITLAEAGLSNREVLIVQHKT